MALRTRLHRRSLDRDLAAGVATWRSPAHAARGRQLTSPRHRRRLADALDYVLAASELPPADRLQGAVPPSRSSVRPSAPQIAALARRLRSDEPIAAAGVVRVEALLCDGAGPIYSPDCADALARALALAEQWLNVGE